MDPGNIVLLLLGARGQLVEDLLQAAAAEHAQDSSIDASACASSRLSAEACWRRKPIKYAVAGSRVSSCIIGV